MLLVVHNRVFEVVRNEDGSARLVERPVSEGITTEIYDTIADNEHDVDNLAKWLT